MRARRAPARGIPREARFAASWEAAYQNATGGLVPPPAALGRGHPGGSRERPGKARAANLPLVLRDRCILARGLDPHGHAALERVAVEIAFGALRFLLAVRLDRDAVQADTGFREHMRDSVGAALGQRGVERLRAARIGVAGHPHLHVTESAGDNAERLKTSHVLVGQVRRARAERDARLEVLRLFERLTQLHAAQLRLGEIARELAASLLILGQTARER